MSFYQSLVGLHMTYCSQLRRPNLVKDIMALQKVQHRATKFIRNDYHSDYWSKLLQLALMQCLCVCVCVKCLINPNNFVLNCICHQIRCIKQTRGQIGRLSSTRHFYFNRIVRLLNFLFIASLISILRYIKTKPKRNHFVFSCP